VIYQAPWFEAGVCAGLVELSLEVPVNMPHFVRQADARGAPVPRNVPHGKLCPPRADPTWAGAAAQPIVQRRSSRIGGSRPEGA